MKLPRPAAKKARIEIIPMIDAIFFLLVFFMFSSLSMVKMNALGVTLPRTPDDQTDAAVASSSGRLSRSGPATPRRLMVTVDSAGAYAVNRNRTDAARLAVTLQEQLGASADAVVVVSVDPSLSTQHLIAVIDALGDVRLPSGKPPTVLIATDPVTDDGDAEEAAP